MELHSAGRAGRCVPCATIQGSVHAERCVTAAVEARQSSDGMFSVAAAAAQRASSNATSAAGRQSDKTGGGAANRATRLHSQSQGGRGSSGCELTPSHVLAEVYHHDALDGTVRGACYRAAAAARSSQPSSYQAVQRGSFASMPPICRHRAKAQLISQEGSTL